jgi:hypothetical protein
MGNIDYSDSQSRGSEMYYPKFRGLHNHGQGKSHSTSPPRLMSKEVSSRLMNREHSHKKICSAKDLLNSSENLRKKRSDLSPIIKPRPMSAEKVLKHDISLSPIHFSHQDEKN